tara:strand:+ start:370 stop:699 length:330 start_codon:yes stop_codon:yes gene_type:complete
MNNTELKKIKDKIEEEIKNTIQCIQEYKELTKPIEPENSIGRVSRMDAINNKSVVEAALRQAQKKLENLKKVNKEIYNESFGICIRCKNSIPIERLLIMPESNMCVKCA